LRAPLRLARSRPGRRSAEGALPVVQTGQRFDGHHIGVAVTRRRLDVIQPAELARAQFDRVGTTFSSTRSLRRVPGIGTMSPPCASSRASAI
jgi:hypothetical protein